MLRFAEYIFQNATAYPHIDCKHLVGLVEGIKFQAIDNTSKIWSTAAAVESSASICGQLMADRNRSSYHPERLYRLHHYTRHVPDLRNLFMEFPVQ